MTLPKPEIYVIYTGSRKKRLESISFAEEFFPGEKCCLDVKINMIYDGKKGDIINQYVSFTKLFDYVLKKYLEGRESEVVDIMFTLFGQEEVWDMRIRSKEKEAAEKAAVETMKATAKKLLKEGRLKVGEVAEFFPDLSSEDVAEVEGEMLERV